MSFEELKKTFTISYGMAASIIAVLFVAFQSWSAIQQSMIKNDALDQRMEKRYKRQGAINDDFQERLRALEIDNSDE